jgi:hypothetical protein
MPEVTVTESKITIALLGDSQDLPIYIVEAISQKSIKGTFSPKRKSKMVEIIETQKSKQIFRFSKNLKDTHRKSR